MYKRLFGFVGAVLIALSAVPLALSQDAALRSAAGDKWVISASAGGVGFLEGTVTVKRADGRTGSLLKGDEIRVGDRVTTGSNGRLEVLLNPGSYLRVAGDTTFEFKTTDLEDLQISVLSGSVMLEVFAANEFKVAVHTPKQAYDLIESGVYRVDVTSTGDSRIEVWKGKAEVGESVLKGGRTASTLDGQVAKFDRDERDEFESWSRERAKELAKATNSLRDRGLRSTLTNSFMGGRWNMYNSFGLWVYDTRFSRYCFLPFGYGWSSPYGFGFGTDIWWYRLPRQIYQAPPPTGNTTIATRPAPAEPQIPPGETPPADRPQRVRRQIGDRRRAPDTGETSAPPFVRMQGTGGMTGRDSGGFDTSGPTIIPPSAGRERSTPSVDAGQSSPRMIPPSQPSSPTGRPGREPIRDKDNLN